MLHEAKIILLIIFLINTFFVETYIFHYIKLKKKFNKRTDNFTFFQNSTLNVLINKTDIEGALTRASNDLTTGGRLTQKDFVIGSNNYNEGDSALILFKIQFHLSDTSPSVGNLDLNNN